MCVCVCVCVVEYYSDIKKDKILPFATTQMDLESIVLSKISKTKRLKTIGFHLYEGYKTKKQQTNKQKLIDTENIMVAARGERGWEKVEEGKQGQICGDRRRLDFGW